jgi:hypothetical protein
MVDQRHICASASQLSRDHGSDSLSSGNQRHALDKIHERTVYAEPMASLQYRGSGDARVRYDADVAHASVRVLCGVILAGSAAAGFERSLDLPLINAATAIGESRIESVHTQFHQSYRIPVDSPPIDHIDIVTPFRQIVRVAEERSLAGARPLGTQALLDAVGDRLRLVEIAVELTFHPLNAYAGVPLFEVELSSGTPPTRILPAQTSRVPRFGARVEGAPRLTESVPLNVPGPSEPMLGGTIIAGFDALGLDPTGVYEVVVKEGEQELARAQMNLGNVR